ncbi:hypothetical protein DFH09DRAFT_658687 [Mycena vulgaris]|nr:hypothetical protein DFH09DRAFT_658687 [Mycena vulgaris]
MTTPSDYGMDGTDDSFVRDGIFIIPATPPTDERQSQLLYNVAGGWRSPRSDFGSPGESVYSPVLSESSYGLNSPGYASFSHCYTPPPDHSPLTPLYPMWTSMNLDDTLSSETSDFDSTYIQYPPSNGSMGSVPLSPVLCDLPLPGSGSPKLQIHSFQDNFDASSVLSLRESDFSQESLLFGPTPPHPLPDLHRGADPSAFASRRSSTSRTRPDLRVLTTPGSGLLMVPPRRHSFNEPRQGGFFFAPESGASTPNTPSSAMPSSPGTSDETALELVVAHPHIGSPANIQAANRRRKKAARYYCPHPHCNSSFTANHNLKYHLNSHAGIRPFPCACGFSFTTPSVQKRHAQKCRIFLAAASASSYFCDSLIALVRSSLTIWLSYDFIIS